MDENWGKIASSHLKRVMEQQGISQKELMNRLNEKFHLNKDHRYLAQKLYLGTIVLGFYLQCLEVMGLENIVVKKSKKPTREDSIL